MASSTRDSGRLQPLKARERCDLCPTPVACAATAAVAAALCCVALLACCCCSVWDQAAACCTVGSAEPGLVSPGSWGKEGVCWCWVAVSVVGRGSHT